MPTYCFNRFRASGQALPNRRPFCVPIGDAVSVGAAVFGLPLIVPQTRMDIALVQCLCMGFRLSLIHLFSRAKISVSAP